MSCGFFNNAFFRQSNFFNFRNVSVDTFRNLNNIVISKIINQLILSLKRNLHDLRSAYFKKYSKSPLSYSSPPHSTTVKPSRVSGLIEARSCSSISTGTNEEYQSMFTRISVSGAGVT